MNNNLVVLSVYSRTYTAANDDGPSESARRQSRRPPETEGHVQRSGWDPYEVWRTRIRPASKRDLPDR